MLDVSCRAKRASSSCLYIVSCSWYYLFRVTVLTTKLSSAMNCLMCFAPHFCCIHSLKFGKACFVYFPFCNASFLFLGLYKVVADKTPYVSIEEITKKVSIGPTRFGHPCFYSPEDIKLENLTIRHGEHISFNSVEEVNGTMAVNCVVVRNNQSHSFTLPLSKEGKFYECEDDQIYTLKEIAEWKIPKCRNRIVKLSNTIHMWDFSNPLPENFDGCLILTPVYEVQAVMKCK